VYSSDVSNERWLKKHTFPEEEGMLKTAKVPEAFVSLFEKADEYVSSLFKEFEHKPEEGTIRVGGERYILVRGESLFVALFDQLENAFGSDQAQEFIYNMARVIGKSDSKAFAENRGVVAPPEKLSTGPIHFAYSGWAFVNIYDDSKPAPDDTYFLHYEHPNTFESEIYKAKKKTAEKAVCYFSAGYSAGWCSEAFGLEVHAREIRCSVAGSDRCEFIMAPFDKLDGYEKELTK
jgi:V4R domain-containing protein/activator of aromatic catabolism